MKELKRKREKNNGNAVVIPREEILAEIKKNNPQKVVFIIPELCTSMCEILDKVRSFVNTYIIIFSSEFSDAEDVFSKANNFVEEAEDYEIYFGGKSGFVEVKMSRIKKILKNEKKVLKKAGK